MSDLLGSLESLERDALRELHEAREAEALERWRLRYLGARGLVKTAAASLKDVPKEAKPAVGKRVNEVKSALETAFESHRARVGTAPAASALDMTEPGIAPALGRRHVLSRVVDELTEVFGRMGFEAVTGPECEDDEHNFVKLNIPPGHPAREPAENFYVDDPGASARPRMLRSQTSTVQVRTMEARKPPLKIISPGRVYRPDAVDATHFYMFHQLEGLCVGRGVSMVDLKTTLYQFARVYFGEDAQVRLVPSYFPFTEPSAEFYMKIRLRPEQPARWVELGGCGMVDPAVFEAVGYDPEEWTGYAFGFGIERIAMGKHGIPDIRMLFDNDLRFLSRL